MKVDAPVVIVNTSLSPVQQRNLETQIKAKVIDRTQLILEIFGARAQTHAGRLQVEFAALAFSEAGLCAAGRISSVNAVAAVFGRALVNARSSLIAEC